MLTKLNSLVKNKDNSYSNLIIFEIMNNIKIKSALISVFSKEGIAPIVDELVENKVKLYSTGGTYKYISKLVMMLSKLRILQTIHPSLEEE